MFMTCINSYYSPVGKIILAADEAGLCGLWFEDQKHLPREWLKTLQERKCPLLDKAASWLHIYFAGKEPSFKLPLHFTGTDFQKAVWHILSGIPYGSTVTYGDIAKYLAKSRGGTGMSAQAVGGAVSRNNISIMVPCHRVIGSKGNLTGYSGGIERKIALLKLEQSSFSRLRCPGSDKGGHWDVVES